ncbi:hypothetical protein GCM10011521_14860 [Arenimonas soli]|uniref:DUF302 domain-containing protein n=1 Tax=Arenimonas soli TaxID=2269504 RepID=A0ABQ1HHC2_9GAMM|nr:hypothetical protein [Arenimonas soli]GGA77571.1 hypothetical protein GCM10011521_14860 [Arenimonas soli]
MNTWTRRAEVIQSSPLLAITPISAVPPHGHFVFNEMTIITRESVSGEALGRICRIAPTLSHYELKDPSEAIDLDDMARILRVRSPFAINKKLPVVELTLTDEGLLMICPMVRNGQGKKPATEHQVLLSTSCSNEEIAALVRRSLEISAASLAS